MKLNITLLTMITFTARAKPLPPEGLLGPSAAGMERILGRSVPRVTGSSSRREDGCALSKRARAYNHEPAGEVS
jgi:hypothetical protein